MRISIPLREEKPDPSVAKRRRGISESKKGNNPEHGPRLLFFSGGTALKSLSRKLINHTHNSIHIVTPFDSGGSSAKIREFFNIIAVGDLRNRMLALSDRGNFEKRIVARLLSYRLPVDAGDDELLSVLWDLAFENHPVIKIIEEPLRKLICRSLYKFIRKIPCGFDLRGASIGNLVIAGSYLENRNFNQVLKEFEKLVDMKGIVRPVVEKPLHLVAEMENGGMLLGQHLITGKEAEPIKKRIKRVYLVKSMDYPKPVEIEISCDTSLLIRNAQLICYPMGSFYSSLISNLIPSGVCESISLNPAKKVYIPNNGNDPEQYGMTLTDMVSGLIDYLKRGAPGAKVNELLNYVVIDSERGRYPGKPDIKAIEKLGVKVVDTILLRNHNSEYYDNDLLISLLEKLVNNTEF